MSHTAMVLAAGLGSRMRPLTDTVPKPLVRLAGRSLIDHVLDRLATAGVERAIVNVHYKADMIEAHLAHRSGPPAIAISDERAQILDTGGGVAKALPLIGLDPFIIHNSDSVWREGIGANLDRLTAAWDGDRMDCLLMLALGSATIGYTGRGDFSFEPDGRIRRRREQEVVPFVFTGVSIAHPRIFEAVPSGPFSLNLVWNRALLAGRAYGVRMEGLWMHVGTPEALTDAAHELTTAHRA
jgi:MurNAc alpha-1-phosphate uridylyltransferase